MSVSLAKPETAGLTAADRCDRCGAQARVLAIVATGELLFCAHHGRQHVPALELTCAGAVVVGDLGLAL